MGHAGGLGNVHADHVLKQLHKAVGTAGVELLGGLCTLRQIAGARGDPLFEVLVVDEILHRAPLKLAKTGLPQIVHRKLVGSPGEQDVGGLHRTQQGGGENSIYLRVGEPLLQVSQLGAALVAQGQVGAAADVQALQVARRYAVADEMKLEGFHGSHLFWFKITDGA